MGSRAVGGPLLPAPTLRRHLTWRLGRPHPLPCAPCGATETWCVLPRDPRADPVGLASAQRPLIGGDRAWRVAPCGPASEEGRGAGISGVSPPGQVGSSAPARGLFTPGSLGSLGLALEQGHVLCGLLLLWGHRLGLSGWGTPAGLRLWGGSLGRGGRGGGGPGAGGGTGRGPLEATVGLLGVGTEWRPRGSRWSRRASQALEHRGASAARLRPGPRGWGGRAHMPSVPFQSC